MILVVRFWNKWVERVEESFFFFNLIICFTLLLFLINALKHLFVVHYKGFQDYDI